LSTGLPQLVVRGRLLSAIIYYISLWKDFSLFVGELIREEGIVCLESLGEENYLIILGCLIDEEWNC
jgi:hypothetical protein